MRLIVWRNLSPMQLEYDVYQSKTMHAYTWQICLTFHIPWAIPPTVLVKHHVVINVSEHMFFFFEIHQCSCYKTCIYIYNYIHIEKDSSTSKAGSFGTIIFISTITSIETCHSHPWAESTLWNSQTLSPLTAAALEAICLGNSKMDGVCYVKCEVRYL